MYESLFEYKAWANDAAFTALARLGDGDPARAIGVLILHHAHIVDAIFAATLQRKPHPYASANDGPVPALEAQAEATRLCDQWYLGYIPTLDAEQLAEPIDFTFTDGLPGRMSRAEMLTHVLMHGVYHRGQIGLLMRQNGMDPPVDGLTTYLHAAEASTRRR